MTRPNREQALLQEALPAYDVGDELGRGAFGVVYAGRHRSLAREVAIKQLPRAFAADPTVRARFASEARMVASLDHPHIVPVYDFVDREDGICLLIMERCQGALGDHFTKEGVATDEACAAVLACCAGLDFAHSTGLLHRDIKPENLLYDVKGVIKLGDFGIARAADPSDRRTVTGTIMGTPAYMSPEQVRGLTLTPASDVYSVGIMTYELLTGQLPFPANDSPMGFLAHHLVTEPTPMTAARPELPGTIGAVVDRALSKDIADRQGSAKEFALELTKACVGAFGTGWLRRRRFVLHWPEIIAASETPNDASVRTGTILVKADPNREQLLAPPAAGTMPVDFAPPVAASPTSADFTPPTAAPTVPAVPPAAGATSPPAPVPLDGGRPSAGRRRHTWLLAAAVVVALAIVGGIVLLGGDDGQPDSAPSTTGNTSIGNTTIANTTIDTSAVETTAVDINVAAPSDSEPAGSETATTQQAATESTATTTTVNSAPRPPGLDMTVAEQPFAPTPCPTGVERVACIFGSVSSDDATGEVTALYFTEGFAAELEPAGYHIHFYLDSVVAGDERKAGAEVAGGGWKPWDGPFPFTSFGGEAGRTGFTVADIVAAGARNLCAIVADAEQFAIHGTGNCAPVSQLLSVADAQSQLERIAGTYAGSCATGATLILPDGWRAVDLTTTAVADAARTLRPGDVEGMEKILTELVDAGGLIWADGPVEGDFITGLTVLRIDGGFTTADSAETVRQAMLQRGLGADGEITDRTLNGRTIVTVVEDTNRGQVTRYVVPDFGYALVASFRTLDASESATVTDAIAATLMGC